MASTPATRTANQYSTEFILGACDAATTSRTVAFGFTASVVRVLNYAGVPLHLNLGSTGAASTGDPEIAIGETLTVHDLPVSVISLTTTSTTTSTSASGQRVSVAAWGN